MDPAELEKRLGTVEARLTRIEADLAERRRDMLKLYGADLAKKNPGSLQGIWKGITIDEEDFAAAKDSLFSECDLYGDKMGALGAVTSKTVN